MYRLMQDNESVVTVTGDIKLSFNLNQPLQTNEVITVVKTIQGRPDVIFSSTPTNDPLVYEIQDYLQPDEYTIDTLITYSINLYFMANVSSTFTRTVRVSQPI